MTPFELWLQTKATVPPLSALLLIDLPPELTPNAGYEPRYASFNEDGQAIYKLLNQSGKRDNLVDYGVLVDPHLDHLFHCPFLWVVINSLAPLLRPGGQRGLAPLLRAGKQLTVVNSADPDLIFDYRPNEQAEEEEDDHKERTTDGQ